MKHRYVFTLLLILIGLHLQAQLKQPIQGTVQSETGQPLSGVSIRVLGGKATLSTNLGNFNLDANVGDTLSFTYIGYESTQLVISSLNTPIKVTLHQAAGELSEVVVTALGISKEKKSLGYAVQELKSEQLNTTQTPNLVNDLSGKIAGVRVTNSQGDMGSSRIIIRGETSIAGDNQPLFIVDGVPVDNSQLGAGGSRDYSNAIADLNSEDIESVSVLKGPNAAALYGSRAAHGVILIKTKAGKKRKGLGITLNSNNTFSSLLSLPDYQNVFGQGGNGEFSYVDGNGGGLNDNVDESWGPRMEGQLIPQFGSNGEAVPFVAHPDNVKDFFKTGFSTNNSISIADAGDKFSYRLGFNDGHQTGVIPNSKLNKRNISLNTNFKITDKLSLSAVANYLITAAPNLPGVGGKRATSTMLQFTWFGRQVDMQSLKDSYFTTGSPDNWNNAYYPNPYFGAYENTVEQRRDRLIGDIGLTYEITQGLTAHFHSGTDYYNDRRKLKIAYGTSGTPYGSYEEIAYSLNENNTEATLNYDHQLNSDFSVNILAGGNIRNKTYEENDQKAPRLAVGGIYTLDNSRDPLVSSNYYSHLKVYSLYGSAQIGFRNYAFINATARNDWSSTLPSDNLSYFYPSINGTLVFTDLLKISSNTLSYGKIRGGWAKVGADTDPYQLYNTYGFSLFGSNPLLSTSGIQMNSNIRSESTTSTELGLDLGFFHSRTTLGISLYNTNSFNQILKVDITPTSGYTQQLLNAGKINNKGLEIALGVTPVRQQNLSWDFGLNFALNKSEVKYLDDQGELENYTLGTDGTVQVVAAVGKTYGTIIGTAYQRDANGQIVISASGLPQTDPSLKDLGHFTPDWTGGFTNTLRYKSWGLTFLIDASVGGSIYSGTNSTGQYTGVLASTLPGRGAEFGGISYYYPGDDKKQLPVAASGSAPNGEKLYDDGIIAKGNTSDGDANSQIIPASLYYKTISSVDEQYVYDASYVKFREINLSYKLPAAWLNRMGIQGASVALVGRNLFFIYKKAPNIDPETAFSTGNAQGLEDLTLPTSRSYGVNLTVQF
ncbi:TonB-linked outer membrane protein, SusC/RagA family [Arachidicoccus rhizosphaerae]|uniref:TonB-linked outer membrane protein, SusC/RagA family n=1 Tax=Arachidicoccus rhizosphaerae TaxID=551991 RepID=A0A1H4AZP1_9BACT|nr:SusC/RagA family TonB-linked outer membrane protein [Arachidicoccus rhizosphaerae]SEA41339.1 TonB-linked outer membrane protein, SusC/RagA family [Arachidicoccus rhizosphaerae]